MHITICYETQLKRATGVASETVDVPVGASVEDVVKESASRHAEAASVLLDSSGNVRPSVLIFLGAEQWQRNDETKLSDGDTLTLMSPISGG